MSVPSWVVRHQKLLCDLYDRQPLALDMLPYTNEFNGICSQLAESLGRIGGLRSTTYKDVWRALVMLRKNLRVLPLKSKESAKDKAKRHGVKGFNL